MKINPIHKYQNFNSNSRGIPRFLYHLTNADNYEKIIKSGQLKMSRRTPTGVFLFDLQNFLKFWGSSPVWKYSTDDLRFDLLEKVADKTDKVVLLKVTTNNLPNPNNFRIRSQQILYKYPFPIYPQKNDINFSHIETGLLANKAKILNQKKQALEYIYKDDIDIKNIEKIGFINFNDLTYKMYNSKNIMKKLLEGQPEEKAVDKLLFDKIKN